MNSEERRSAWTALSELRQRGIFNFLVLVGPENNPHEREGRRSILVDVA
jgi:hypothetical protein